MQTTDHKTIKQWAKEHDASPATVRNESKESDTSIIRFDINGNNENLHEINWEHFFELFEQNELALVYEPDSNFNKLVSRNS
tara:strand:+ start:822 stop:1067 length:246 start_codon:yes stop_codon:yes gene_type:complete